MNDATLRGELAEIIRHQRENTQTIAHLRNIAVQQRDSINEKNAFITSLTNQLSLAQIRTESLLSDKLVMGCMLKYFEGRVQKLEDEQHVSLPIHITNEVRLPITIQAPASAGAPVASSSDVIFSLTAAQLKYLLYGSLVGMEATGMVLNTSCVRPSVMAKKVVKKTFAKVFGKKKTKKTAYRTCIGVAEPFPLPPAQVVV